MPHNNVNSGVSRLGGSAAFGTIASSVNLYKAGI